MIHYAQGDIFDTPADIRVNTVNTVGVMGAGVALAFKTRYPEMFKEYVKVCKKKQIYPGKPHIWVSDDLIDKSITIINLPTKVDWRNPSTLEYVEKGLKWLRGYLLEKGNVTVTLPALGCGHGGLEWETVKRLIEHYLIDSQAEILVFPPSASHEIEIRVQDSLDKTTISKLEEQGIKLLTSGGTDYPQKLQGRSAYRIYLKGNPNLLSGPIISIIPSVKPSSKELEVAKAIVEELSKRNVTIMLGYSPKIEHELIQIALKHDVRITVVLSEGILISKAVDRLKDEIKSGRVSILSPTNPNQPWKPYSLGKSTFLKFQMADSAIITDENPLWLKKYESRDNFTCKIFFIKYENQPKYLLNLYLNIEAQPIGRQRDSGLLNILPIIDGIGLDESKKNELIDNYKETNRIREKYIMESENQVQTYPKRLIEVDLPIKRISAHARREKSIRHGHISTLHIWWARRPLAACRAVICASLWPDPADEHCPESFQKIAREQMILWAKKHLRLLGEESYSRFVAISKNMRKLNDLVELRTALLDFIADFSNWDNSFVTEYLETSRLLTQAAHEALGGEPGSRPLVVDPFAGGGAIPLEALRVGADVFASDLNPVSVLLNKVMLENLPNLTDDIIEEIQTWGERIREQAVSELDGCYPSESNNSNSIAYLWTRTILSEAPGNDELPIELPLIGTFWLSKRKGRRIALRWVRDNKGEVETEIIKVQTNNTNMRRKIRRPLLEIFEPRNDSEVEQGVVRSGSATCPVTGHTTTASRVRKQLSDRSGGTKDARLIAVIETHKSEKGRFYRLPSQNDLQAITKTNGKIIEFQNQKIWDMSYFPDEPTPEGIGKGAGRAFAQRNYGMTNFSDLYTCRQLITLSTIAKLIREIDDSKISDTARILLVFALGRVNDLSMSLCRWLPTIEAVAAANGGQNRMPVTFDFIETNPFGGSGGDWIGQVKWITKVVKHIHLSINHAGSVERSAAQTAILPEDSADLLFTDPPYYDAFPYSDLSDFFFIWFKRTLPSRLLSYNENLVPKDDEIVVYDVIHGNDGRIKDGKYFQSEMTEALTKYREVTKPNSPGVVVFANKTTSGWEALIKSLFDSGWIIKNSWPIDTERAVRQRALGSAALGSSVHIVCYPRENPDGSLQTERIGDWRDILTQLPKRIHEWMPRLSKEGIVGADAIFACLGPALEIYSRYSSVEKASGEKVELQEYLEEVWAAVSREALNMIFEGADSSGFEEDARLTAMWLWTLRTALNGSQDEVDFEGAAKTLPGYSLEYDAARKIAQGLGAHLEQLTHLVEIKGDTAMLLSAGSRTRYLFGKGAEEIPQGRRKKKTQQTSLKFEEELQIIEEETGNCGGDLSGKPGTTVLDQLHQCMILFGAGRGEAMKRILIEEGIGRNPLFWRLAQSLSALYPVGTDEKRWVDGVLARKKGLGL